MIQPGLGSEAREGIRGGDGGVGDGTGRLGGHSGGAADRRHHAWSIVEAPREVFRAPWSTMALPFNSKTRFFFQLISIINR